MSNTPLLAAAFSSIFHTEILSKDALKKKSEGERAQIQALNLDVDSLIKASYSTGFLGDAHRDDPQCTVVVKTLTGRSIRITATPQWPIAKIMEKVEAIEGIPASQQRLMTPMQMGVCTDYYGKPWDKTKKLSDYNITADSVVTIHVERRLVGGGVCPKFLDPLNLDPYYDFDFTSRRPDGRVFNRGGFTYSRPYGWNRFALKVKGKHENDDWLGSPGNRTETTDKEWPVSYHGTTLCNALSISDKGFLCSKGERFRFGDGIYSSPNIEVAEQFASEFQHDGKRYKVVFQNRCNPDPTHLEIVNNAETRQAGGQYWVSKNDDNIRPYSICLKRF